MTDAQKVKALLSLLTDIEEELDGRMDTVDTDDGPAPNWAMNLVSSIRQVRDACASQALSDLDVAIALVETAPPEEFAKRVAELDEAALRVAVSR